jgi:hypothetical protein
MAAILSVVFASGALMGASAAVVVVQRTAHKAFQNPEVRTQKATRWLTRRLSLDAGQQERVRAIMESQSADLQALRREVWPRVLTRLDETESQVDAALTPKQSKRWKKMAARLRRNWLGRHRN